MTDKISSSSADVDQAVVQSKAARVGADVLALYRQLAATLRQKGRSEAAAMARLSDPTARAAHRCAFQLYGTAASELDDVIADLLASLERPFTEVSTGPILTVVVGDGTGP